MAANARKGMNPMIPQYRKFKFNLRGWFSVPFTDFKDAIVPLKQNGKWDSKQKEMVGNLVSAGCGFALKELFKGGKGATELRDVFRATKMGDGPDAPEESTKEELESHMKALLKSCKTDGWTQSNFESFLAYLDSDMTVKDLANVSTASSSMFRSAGSTTPAADAKAPSTPETDLFAMKFRIGSENYKNVVRACLKSAASAPE